MFDNPFDDKHRFDYFESSDNEDDDTLNLNVMVNDDDDDVDNDIDDDVMMKSYLLNLNLRMLLGLVLLFLMIVYKVINIFQEGLSWRLDKHSTVKMNWLMLLNDDTSHIHLNTESNGRTLYLFNYNVCKNLNLRSICVRDIIKGRIHFI